MLFNTFLDSLYIPLLVALQVFSISIFSTKPAQGIEVLGFECDLNEFSLRLHFSSGICVVPLINCLGGVCVSTLFPIFYWTGNWINEAQSVLFSWLWVSLEQFSILLCNFLTVLIVLLLLSALLLALSKDTFHTQMEQGLVVNQLEHAEPIWLEVFIFKYIFYVLKAVVDYLQLSSNSIFNGYNKRVFDYFSALNVILDFVEGIKNLNVCYFDCVEELLSSGVVLIFPHFLSDSL